MCALCWPSQKGAFQPAPAPISHTCDIGHSPTVPGGLFYLCETLVPMSASRGRDRCDCNAQRSLFHVPVASGPSFMSRLPMIRLRQGDAPVVNSHLPKAKRQAMVTQWPDCGHVHE